jgi:hypothetical protein
MEGSVDEDCNRSDEEYDDLAMRDSMENGYLSDDGMVHTGVINRFLDGNQQHSHRSTPRKKLETLRSLSKIETYVPDTARSPSSVVAPPGTAGRRNAAARRVRRTLSDSFRSRPRSCPSLAEPATKPEGSIVHVAPDR